MNLYSRLRALLPAPPLLLARVLSVHSDGTSTVSLPSGLPATAYSSGLAAGSELRVRGDGISVGGNAFIRAGVIESQAPDGSVVEGEVGVVAALPFGPLALQLVEAVPAQAGAVGGAYSLDLAAFVSGGYLPITFSLVGGALPAGIALDAASSRLAGTFTAAGSFTVSVGVADSTHATLPPLSVAFVVAA